SSGVQTECLGAGEPVWAWRQQQRADDTSTASSANRLRSYFIAREMFVAMH
ncbi:hypothetical protein BaRGS_00031682, partial [Batillaria attramentaria]